MNVDILSFVIIIITVDYIQELRSGGQAPSNRALWRWAEMRLYYHSGKESAISGSWSAKLLSYLFKELNKHDVRILCDFFSLAHRLFVCVCLGECVQGIFIG